MRVDNGFRPAKSRGQNFLVDPNIPEKIVRLAGFCGSDGVLEVGPGIGALTTVLCRAAGHVTAVEIDERLIPVLREAIGGSANVDIVRGDILKLDIARLLVERMPGLDHHVCSNLPYNITTPALTEFIDAGVFKTITVMIQKEVAERICALPGTPEYGAFTIYANYHTEPEILFIVPPECFRPRPSVYSAVVRMKTREKQSLAQNEEVTFFKVVRAAFGQRRKTLVNALCAVFGNTLRKDELADAVHACGFDGRVRGEVLGVEDFAKLSQIISKLEKL